MKMFRYRKPSVKSVLGVTKAKRRVKKAIGVNAVMKPLRTPTNVKRKCLRKFGWYSSLAKIIRHKKPPTPLGL